jgi:hypothetical protein
MSIPRKHVDWKLYDSLPERRGKDAAFARSIGIDPRNFPQYKKSRYKDEPTSNGNLPAIPVSQSIAVPSPHIAVASPSIAADMDELRARVASLEAFMAVVQSEHRSASQSIAISSQPIAAHRDGPWVSRGLQMAPDMLEAIDAYATRHRLEKRAVLDLALRHFFSHVGEEATDA